MILGIDLRPDLMLRLLVAAVLGAAIGLERTLGGKPAGFRTNLLICVGAALITDLSISMAVQANPTMMRSDPERLAAQIVSGIGFLGAGTILQARGSITGLTTAATLWVAAAIGIAVGAGEYAAAVATTVLVLVALSALGWLEATIIARRAAVTLRVVLDPRPEALRAVLDVLHRPGLDVTMEDILRETQAYVAVLHLAGRKGVVEDIADGLLQEDGVRRVEVD